MVSQIIPQVLVLNYQGLQTVLHKTHSPYYGFYENYLYLQLTDGTPGTN